MTEGALLSIAGFALIGASAVLYWINRGRKMRIDQMLMRRKGFE